MLPAIIPEILLEVSSRIHLEIKKSFRCYVEYSCNSFSKNSSRISSEDSLHSYIFSSKKSSVNFPDVLPVLHILENSFGRSSRITFTSSFLYFFTDVRLRILPITPWHYSKKILGNSSRRILKSSPEVLRDFFHMYHWSSFWKLLQSSLKSTFEKFLIVFFTENSLKSSSHSF